MKQEYCCGWDGGGSKTEVLCLTAEDAVLGQAAFGPLNINGADENRIGHTIGECLSFMAGLPGGLSACRALVIGTAGVSNTAAVGFIEEQVRALGYTGPLRILGDQEIVLAGAVKGTGAVLIAGTGSVCLGRDETGRTARAGGYGHLIDDGGSGYAIGRDILRAVVRAQDGRGTPTLLAPLVFEQLGINSVTPLITWLYAPGTGKKEVASLAPLLLRALEAGDDAAARIAHTAAAELAALVCAVFDRLSRTEGELVLSGSILSHYPVIAQEMLSLCAVRLPGVRPVPMRGTAAQGAARLALQAAGLPFRPTAANSPACERFQIS